MLGLGTPFGWPVAWAEAGLSGRVGDWAARPERQGLVVSGRRLGDATPNAFDDFLLCLVGDGVAGARSSQVAQAAFVGAFLASDEMDVLWRLRDAMKAADRRAAEGRLRCTLTALFVAGDGTCYGVSVGNSPLRVVRPGGDEGGNRRAQKLGHEQGTAVGTSETVSATSGEGTIEQWWPDMEGDGTRTRLEAGTVLLLGGSEATAADGVGNGVAGIVVRFDGRPVGVTSRLVADSGWLVSVVGYSGGAFGLVCLSDELARGNVPGMLRRALELDRDDGAWSSREELERSIVRAGGDAPGGRLAVVARGQAGAAAFATGGASGEVAMADGRPGQAFILRLGSDPLDRGVRIEFLERAAPQRARQVDGRESRPRRWMSSVVRRWRRWRRR